MKIFLVRSSYSNEFELQNYEPISKSRNIQVVASKKPLTPISLKTIKLQSPADLSFPYKKQILNRLIGGEHWLINLQRIIPLGSIIHTAETYFPYTHQAVELRKQGLVKKLVSTCWETIPHANEKFPLLRKWKNDAYKYVDCFHTPTLRAKEVLVAEGVHPTRVKVIPYGVDLARFKPKPHKLKKRSLILTVARLEKEKGMKDLEIIARSLPQYDFLVVGKGSCAPIGKNIKVKRVAYKSIHKVYQSADLFFLPSRTTKTWEEQYGMALVEAMATGLPIVTTNCGAIPEIVGNAAVVVREGGVDAMRSAILHLLTNAQEREKLGNKAYERAKARYDHRKCAKDLISLYR
jgi:glycosyltransferase involved in cell wall biosynthesis